MNKHENGDLKVVKDQTLVWNGASWVPVPPRVLEALRPL